jgi:hypothetical protein
MFDIRAFEIENLAYDLVVAHERIILLEGQVVTILAEAQAYRMLAQEAIHVLHALTIDHQKLRQQQRELVEEYRGFRERILREAGVTP